MKGEARTGHAARGEWLVGEATRGEQPINQPESRARTDNDYFRMGAAVAVGELYDAGRLGVKSEVAGEVRAFLRSFGINGIEDVRSLGVTGPYIEDFASLYR